LNAELVFVGDGILKKSLERYVRKNSIKNVHFVGFQNMSKVSKFYSIADIYVSCSEWDVASKALNEAMNFRLALILCNTLGTAFDLVKEGKNGYIFPLGNTDKLAFYLKDLIKNKDKIREFGEESFKIVSKWNFDEEVKGLIRALDYISSEKND